MVWKGGLRFGELLLGVWLVFGVRLVVLVVWLGVRMICGWMW